MDETITLPRAVVAALVDPTETNYIDWEENRCAYCLAAQSIDTNDPPHWRDATPHTASCPVRCAQEALAHANL